MRVLIITDEEREAAHKVALYAALPEHHYKPGPGVKPPGDNPNHVVVFNSFKCVFSFTEFPSKHPKRGDIFRHLSVSVPDPKAYPHPTMVENIALLFGFKGKLEDWQVAPHEREHCIIVAQPL